MAAEVCGKGGWTAAGVSTERRCCGRGEVGVGGGGSACLGWSSGEHLGWVHTCPGARRLHEAGGAWPSLGRWPEWAGPT